MKRYTSIIPVDPPCPQNPSTCTMKCWQGNIGSV